MTGRWFSRGVLTFLALVAAGRAAAQPAGVFLDLGVRSTSPGGSAMFVSANAEQASAWNSGLKSENRVDPIPGVRWIGDRYRIEASYRPLTFRGPNSFSVGFPFDAAVRSTLDGAHTRVDVDHLSVGARRDVFTWPSLSVGVGVDLDRLETDSTVTMYLPAVSRTTDRRTYGAPVATVALNVHDAERRAFLDLELGYSNLLQRELTKARVEAGYGVFRYAGVKASWEGLRFDDWSSILTERKLTLSTFSGGVYFRF